jgi:hypothetical protein
MVQLQDPSKNVRTIIPFLTCFSIGYLKPIVLTKDGIHTLADIVIIDPIQVDLLNIAQLKDFPPLM